MPDVDPDALDAVLARFGGIRVAVVRLALENFQRRLPGRFSARDVADSLRLVVRPTLTPDEVREIAAGLGLARAQKVVVNLTSATADERSA